MDFGDDKRKFKKEIEGPDTHRSKISKDTTKPITEDETEDRIFSYERKLEDKDDDSHYDYTFKDYTNMDIALTEKSWKISACNIFTNNAFPVYNWDFGSQLREYDSNIIFTLADTLEKFASESLETDLLGFFINDEFLVIKELDQHYLLMNFYLGDNVQLGYETPLSKEFDRISQEIDQILSLHYTDSRTEVDDLRKEAIYQVISTSKSRVFRQPKSLVAPEFDISMVFVMDPHGIPLLARTYDHKNFKEDPILVSTFMHALQVFYSTHIRDQLKKIQFTKHLCHIRQVNDYTYGIVLRLDTYSKISKNNPIHSICEDMLNKFIQSVEMMGKVGDISIEIMNNLSDSFVEESYKDLDM